MGSKLLARLGACVFVGLAVTMTLVQLLGNPAARPDPAPNVSSPDSDPLSAQMMACAHMGEAALSSPECRAAWAENRRRFFGVDHPEAYAGLQDRAAPPMTDLPLPFPADDRRGED